MLKSIVVMFLSSLMVSTAMGQGKISCLKNEDVLLDKTKPAIYLTFERSGERTPRSPDESSSGIWLRLHNNTHWPITTYAGSLISLPKSAFTPLSGCQGNLLGLLDGVEIAAAYFAEADAGSSASAPKVLRHDSLGSDIWLAPGQSLIFSVAREHLGKHLSIYVPFNYQWEQSEVKVTKGSLFGIANDNVKHRVYFNDYQLPAETR